MKQFLVTLFLGFSMFASAQNKIIGTITDIQNKPLSRVTISIPEVHKETISDENGNYSLTNFFSVLINIISFFWC